MKSMFLCLSCCVLGVVCVFDLALHANMCVRNSTRPAARVYCKLQYEIDFFVIFVCCALGVVCVIDRVLHVTI